LADAGVEILPAASLRDALVALRKRGVRSMFVEGGARLAGSLLRDGLADRLTIFQSPLVLGGEPLGAFAFAPDGFETSLAGRRVVERRMFGDDVMTTYALTEVASLCSPG
jgi:diaminohydroxyphosphoribosylaminopyrimidine deaminase/5-amino-6-(5-phosphoribosylamino)uracil reductase